MKFEYLDLHTLDAYFNLACEQYVFDELPRDRSYLMLWQNRNTIVIGRYQNTYSQINSDYVRQHGINVARRLSGGGAVYHDMGNLNYTVITDAGDMDALNMQLFCLPVVRTLRSLGVNAEVNGRNDITVDGKKFSGNSQYVKNGRVMHHGTVLFDSDLSVVGEALRVDESKIAGKGVASVRSRVTNVRPYLKDGVTLPDFRSMLLKEVTAGSEAVEHILSDAELEKITAMREQYASWEWNFGRSPAFTASKVKRFDGCGRIEACLSSEHGRVTSLEFYGDFFSFLSPELLAERFIGVCLSENEFRAVLRGISPADYFSGIDKEEFSSFMLSFTGNG